MLALKDQYSIKRNDLVICLISGGGSALMPCPVDGITLEDKKKITKQRTWENRGEIKYVKNIALKY